MIKGISYQDIKSKIKTTFYRFHNLPLCRNPKLQALENDTLILSEAAKTHKRLSDKPYIVQGKFNSGINDDRFEVFLTEYRAYDFPGYDNKFPSNYTFVDSLGDTRLRPHIYLKMVEVKPEFARQGVYSEAIKKLIEASKREGCEGRITLDSMQIEREGMTQIPSPSLAHWKAGFRFANSENNSIMEKVLRGELPLEQAPTGSMYLEL